MYFTIGEPSHWTAVCCYLKVAEGEPYIEYFNGLSGGYGELIMKKIAELMSYLVEEHEEFHLSEEEKLRLDVRQWRFVQGNAVKQVGSKACGLHAIRTIRSDSRDGELPTDGLTEGAEVERDVHVCEAISGALRPKKRQRVE